MAHITAGDLSPITYKTESTYGTPTGSSLLYGDIAEGGKFTMQDDNNTYLSWRYGDRSFNPYDYVTQQLDAAYNDIIEVRDAAGWNKILEYALGNSMGTQFYGSLSSRTTEVYVRTGVNAYQGRVYHGCKTDSLTIKADAPGGIVKFEESVLASYAENDDILAPLGPWVSAAPAVQWMAGATIGGSAFYPQSFSITINNNLSRSYKPQSGGAITNALLEGRREITAEFDCWMEDLANIRASIANNSVGNIELVLGISNPIKLTLAGVRWLADGKYPDFAQDKQRETLRFRAIQVATAPVTPGV